MGAETPSSRRGPPAIVENDCSDTYIPWYTSITRRFHTRHGGVFHILRSVLREFENHMCEDISKQSRQFRNLLNIFDRVNIHSLGGLPQAPPLARGVSAPSVPR